METRDCFEVDLRNGNLHIDIEGRFTQDTAEALTSAMVATYKGEGNIFIHTSKITDVAPDSRMTFGNLLGGSGIPKSNVYLMGERGSDLSSESTRVIKPKKKKHGHGSCGRCKNCKCDK